MQTPDDLLSSSEFLPREESNGEGVQGSSLNIAENSASISESGSKVVEPPSVVDPESVIEPPPIGEPVSLAESQLDESCQEQPATTVSESQPLLYQKPIVSRYSMPVESSRAESRLSMPSSSSRALDLESEILELKRALISREAAVREAQWAQEQMNLTLAKTHQDLMRVREREVTLENEVGDLKQRLMAVEEKRRQDHQLREETDRVLELEREAHRRALEDLRAELDTVSAETLEKEKAWRAEQTAAVQQLGMAEKKYLTLQMAHDRTKRLAEEMSERATMAEQTATETRAQVQGMTELLAARDARVEALALETEKLRNQLNEVSAEAVQSPGTAQSQSPGTAHRQLLLSEALQAAEAARREAAEWKEKYQTRQFEARKAQRRSNDDRLVVELEQSRARIVALEQTLVERAEQYDDLEIQNLNLQRDITETRLEVARYLRYKDALEDRLAESLQDGSTPAAAIKDLVAENLELREAVRAVEAQARDQLQAKSAEMLAKLKETQTAVEEHNKRKTAIIDDLTSQLNTLRSRCEEYAARVASLEGEIARQVESQRRTAAESGLWETEKARFQQRLDLASSQLEAVRVASQTLQTEKLDLSMELGAKASELKFVAAQLDRENERSARLLKQLDEAAADRARIQQEANELKAKVAELNSVKDRADVELSNFRTQLNKASWDKNLVEEELRALKAEMSNSAKVHNETRVYLEEQSAKFEAWLRQVQAENTDLREKLKEAELTIRTGQESADVKDSEIFAVKTELAKLKESNDSSAIAKTELENKIKILEATLDEKDAQIATLRKDFHFMYERSHAGSQVGASSHVGGVTSNASEASSVTGLAPLSKIVDDTASLDGDNAQNIELLRAESEARKATIVKLENALRELENETVAVLRPQLERAAAEARLAEDKQIEAERRVASLEADLGRETQRAQQLESRIASAETAQREAEEKVRSLQLRVSEMELKVAEAEEAARKDQEELEASRVSYRAVVQAHAADMLHAETSNADRVRLMGVVDELRGKLEAAEREATRERADFEKYMNKARADLASLQTAHDDLQKEFDQIAARVTGTPTTDAPPATISSESLLETHAVRQRDALAAELQALKIDATQLRARNQAVEATLDQLRTQLADSNAKVGELRRKLTTQAAMYSPDLHLERTSLQRQLEEIEMVKAQLQTECTRLEKELDEERSAQLPLRTQIDAKERMIITLQGEVERLAVADKTWQKEYAELVATYKPKLVSPAAVESLKSLVVLSVRHSLLAAIMLKMRPAALVVNSRKRLRAGDEDNAIEIMADD